MLRIVYVRSKSPASSVVVQRASDAGLEVAGVRELFLYTFEVQCDQVGFTQPVHSDNGSVPVSTAAENFETSGMVYFTPTTDLRRVSSATNSTDGRTLEDTEPAAPTWLRRSYGNIEAPSPVLIRMHRRYDPDGVDPDVRVGSAWRSS